MTGPDYFACGGSVQGTRHIQGSIPCEDAWAFENLPGCLVLAVADGLSSADYGGKGAEAAVTACVREVAGLIKMTNDDGEIPVSDIIRDGIARGRSSLTVLAETNEHPLSSYATTLALVVMKGDCVWCGHIGDGVCACVFGDDVSVLSAPGNAEYANETAVLTARTWEKHLRISSGKADAVLLATDGCQGALIRREEGGLQPYKPFIIPLVKALREYVIEGRDCNAEICDLLFSDRMRALSSDDMTLAAGFSSPGEPV